MQIKKSQRAVKEMKYIAIIPSRYSSTRFPGKPLADIDGKPMIRHVYERVREVYPECCVATDDDRIKNVVEGFGGEAIMTSSEHRSGTDRCREALERYEQLKGERFDVVVNVQGDEPFIRAEHLEAVKAGFLSQEAEIVTLAHRIVEGATVTDPNSPKVVLTRAGYAMYFSRSPIPYIRGHKPEEWTAAHDFLKHIGIYGYRSDVLRTITELEPGELEKAESLEQLRWLENGFRIRVVTVSEGTIGVDTPEDLIRIQKMLKH